MIEVMTNKEFLAELDNVRSFNDGKLPKGWADFIGIHEHKTHFSLSSPLCLVDERGNRPSFESECFESFEKALERAEEVTAANPRVFILNCGKTF